MCTTAALKPKTLIRQGAKGSLHMATGQFHKANMDAKDQFGDQWLNRQAVLQSKRDYTTIQNQYARESNNSLLAQQNQGDLAQVSQRNDLKLQRRMAGTILTEETGGSSKTILGGS